MDEGRTGKNQFFECAIAQLKKTIFKYGTEEGENYCFIYFHVLFIRFFLKRDFLSTQRDKKIIIISTTEMQSLALFYYQQFSNVLAIIDASESVQNIIDVVRETYREKTRRVLAESTIKALTVREFTILLMILNGSDIHSIARRLNIAIKTVYAHGYSVAKKMGVRKVHDLIIFR
ncbi:LuxR C-terminal-related transcriptional regulator [Serratia fonticola]|uniref:LuxR C-terminal-related transcriptional regulator n=2 Tax=Serratia fonticola TaxID=47917 RepID=UPI001AE3CB17|nr:LuxR C-terminal-related transcriptional regulator [Serratia fonticola]MBP1000591.1 hypothetical protein [Serratia fonticola]MBP1005603.1 hypothetical protein [Serratia fonticola]MBP1015272.1 hypothetical protein [Serratia fonticola]MBP1020202.1 hypothetical protein [Serratia fonticola]